MEILANGQHRGRHQEVHVPARNVPAQVHHSSRHGDRGEEPEPAVIGLVLIEAQEVHTAVIQQAQDVFGIKGGNEEPGV